MDKQIAKKTFIPIVGLFLVLNGAIIFLKKWLESKGADQEVLLGGNVLLFAVSLISFFLYSRGMSEKNTQAFLRNVYGGMLIKLFTCIIAAFVYIYSADGKVNKPALFGCMGLYMLYTFIEMKGVLTFNKAQRKDA